jgi:lia operon protein LiaG
MSLPARTARLQTRRPAYIADKAVLTALLTAMFVALPLSLTAQSSERFTLRGDRVAVWNLAGRVTVEPTSGSEVVVEVTRGGDDGRRLSVESSADRLVVRYPDRDVVYREVRRSNFNVRLTVANDGTFESGYDEMARGRSVALRSSGGGLEAHADLRILVPRGQRLRLMLGVGEIDASNVEGDIELSTRVTGVTATGMKGRLSARSGSGTVRVERSEADVVATTGSGSVELRNVKGREVRASTGSGMVTGYEIAAERFETSTGSGGVRVEELTADDVRASAGSGTIRLEMTRLADAVIRTGSGSVNLTLPPVVNVEVEINTGSGDISTDFPVTMEGIRRRELRGRIGTGEDGRVRVTTGSGSVRLLKR